MSESCSTPEHSLSRLKSHNRAYAASFDPTMGGSWGKRSFSPFEELTGDLGLLASRAQAAYRNNPWLARAIDVKVAQEIGTGIVTKPQTGDHELDDKLTQLYLEVKDYLDFDGITNMSGLQQGVVRGRHLSGDGFMLVHKLKPSRATHLPIPLQFQLIDASFCPYDLNELLNNGNRIINGVEVNGQGQKVAYWFSKTDPELKKTSIGGRLSDYVRVLAENVIHNYIPKRAGQLRAVPEIIKGIPKAVAFEKYNDAELTRKGVRANLTGAIEKNEITTEDAKYDSLTGAPLDYEHGALPAAKIESGTFLTLLAGEKVNLFQTDDAGRGYHDYQKWQLLAVAAATNTPYQLISGDFEGINDRLWRAIFNDMKRSVQATQYAFTIPQVPQSMWGHILERALLVKRISKPKDMSIFLLRRAKHQPQRWDYIHPEQDVNTKIKELKAGIVSRSTLVDESSNEECIEQLDATRAKDYQREVDLGIPSILDENKQPEPTSPDTPPKPDPEHPPKKKGEK